jgi:hypothetical protein
MRMILAFALLVVSLPAAAQTTDACTVDNGIHVGSPACPYQWVGATTVAYDGTGNGLGYTAMTSQCRADFGPGARMCKSEEVMDSDTLNLNQIPVEGCWLRPSWRPLQYANGAQWALDESGRIADPHRLSCVGWIAGPDSNVTGLALTQIGVTLAACVEARPVACCKPTPVPAPTSSLTLPIGAASLASLAKRVSRN